MKVMLSIILIISFNMLFIISCQEDENVSPDNINFRQEMRNFVAEISKYAKGKNSGFNIVPQNGQELVTTTGEPEDEPILAYLDAIDATGREDLFYGYVEDDIETPDADKNYLIDLCNIFEENNSKNKIKIKSNNFLYE